MGIIMMVGIVVSFSVLLVDFANRLRAEARERGTGEPAAESVVRAARTRMRPIVMTSLAAVLGLTPMAVAGGANIPLARAVVGGILAAAASVLFVVPILYVAVENRRPAARPERR